MSGRRPASRSVKPVDIVHILALHPGLRELFPLADQVDIWVRWSA